MEGVAGKTLLKHEGTVDYDAFEAALRDVKATHVLIQCYGQKGSFIGLSSRLAQLQSIVQPGFHVLG